jgi:CDP-glucose 4,6-dehydratase
MDRDFWRRRRVFVTGHTGFKGAWLSLWLERLGAAVTGFALGAPTEPSLFAQAAIARSITSIQGDVRDLLTVREAMDRAAPEIVIHMAAQSLVRASYADPVATYTTNVVGTVHVLECARHVPSVRAVVNVTSDKCYENREWVWPYRESDPMGGYDPYSSSKGCAELVASAFARSFYRGLGRGLASVRAGNVIGGGDWAADRLIPDAARAFSNGRAVRIRNPASVRPWQHVLEPLAGYLTLAERLFRDPERWGGGWNFGPDERDIRPVSEVIDTLAGAWGGAPGWERDGAEHPHEAQLLRLDVTKSRTVLGWRPRLDLSSAVGMCAEWYKAVGSGADARDISLRHIERYEALLS